MSECECVEDFEIMPFEFLPAHIRWAFGQYVNKEAGWIEFETVDDVDWEVSGDGLYGAIFRDGSWTVQESFEYVLDELVYMEG